MSEDKRPLFTAAPEYVRQLAEEFCNQLDGVFEQLWEKAVHASAAATERGECNADEAQNNALSLFSQVAAYPHALLAEHLSKAKGIPPAHAVAMALVDMKQRTLAAFETAGGCPVPEVGENGAVWAAREWLLDQADVEAAAMVAERECNAFSERLNDRATPHHAESMTASSSLVCRALMARAVLQTAGDWLAMESGMPPEIAQGAIRSIADELPQGLAGESKIKKELVQ
jgi:hypothetical protein